MSTAASAAPKRPRSASPADSAGAASTAGPSRALSTTSKSNKQWKRTRRARHGRAEPPEPYSAPDVLQRDIRDFLGQAYVDSLYEEGGEEALWEAPVGLERGTELEVRVGAFTVSGESLSLYEHDGKKWAILTPFAHPGDLIRLKVWKMDRLHACAYRLDTLEWNEAARGGEGDRRKFPDQGCKYFGACGGCQLQPMPYTLQLEHKRRTLDLAYKRFSALPEDIVPAVLPTIPSPKQWGYRTKITPHFEAMPKSARSRQEQEIAAAAASVVNDSNGAASAEVPTLAAAADESTVEQVNGLVETEETRQPDEAEQRAVNGLANGAGLGKGKKGRHGEREDTRPPWSLKIGFEKKAGKGVLDIEECPIAAPLLNAQMTIERSRVQQNIMSYNKGAQILLRDSLPPPSLPDKKSIPTRDMVPAVPEDQHVAITSHHALIYERVNEYLFEFGSNSFFQNNNSILPSLVQYVKDAVFPSSTDSAVPGPSTPTHLVDAYCGSGLFGITLSKSFEQVAGVEISEESITAAKRNAQINGLENSTWLCGKAEEIFEGLPERGFKGENSCVIVDPPRKGCDEPFLAQLLRFKPLTIVYVSCNVHTQARDVGWFLRAAEAKGSKYVLESLRGFDLFPQTAHVEGVAVLKLQT